MMRRLRARTILLAASVCAWTLATPAASAEPVLFLSTQLTPVTEATMMRQVILKNYSGTVSFEPYDRAVYNAKVAGIAGSPAGPVVLGGVQEDFSNLRGSGALAGIDAAEPRLSARVFLPGLAERGKLGTDTTWFIPWMQATYIMAANRRALPYLPRGADLNRLSYDELEEWAANMYRVTGKGRLSFPVGSKGLMQRFLQGYLYPSYTGSMTGGFAGTYAVIMWGYLRDLWQYVDPSALITNRMDEALLNGEVWVAWDHTARLLEAFKRKPDEFIAFPAPVGPKGRGFISVLAGLGAPKGSLGTETEALMEYLTRPEVQVKTMESVGFLPVVEIGRNDGLSKGLSAIMQAAVEQLKSPDAIVSSLPLRTADAGRSFDLVYTVAFSRIVLRRLDISTILARQEKMLRAIEAETPPGARP
jgi:multiple sugar transport system substrate-binding protein